MKALALLLLPLIATPALAGNFFGPGPFSLDGYWPGYLDGKYQAAVTGQNIIGVVGFAIVDGAPPTRETETQEPAGNSIVTRNVNLNVDPFQNYFLIFHEGRSYRGLTTAMIDLDAKQITGALQGTDPAGVQPFGTVAGGLDNSAADALAIVNRGLSGGFRAKIKQNAAVFTFSGAGQLSSAANQQTVTLTGIPAVYIPTDDPPSPGGTITNEFIAGQVVTTSTPFNMRGIKTSYFATNAVSSASLIGGGQ